MDKIHSIISLTSLLAVTGCTTPCGLHKPELAPAKVAESPVAPTPQPPKAEAPIAQINEIRKLFETEDTPTGYLVKIKSDTLFEAGHTQPQAQVVASLRKLGNLLSQIKDPIRLEGYTDSLGKKATNLRLSQERADALKAIFVEEGVESSRIQAKGYGTEKPVASNDSVAGRNANRRVEIYIDTRGK